MKFMKILITTLILTIAYLSLIESIKIQDQRKKNSKSKNLIEKTKT